MASVSLIAAMFALGLAGFDLNIVALMLVVGASGRLRRARVLAALFLVALTCVGLAVTAVTRWIGEVGTRAQPLEAGAVWWINALIGVLALALVGTGLVAAFKPHFFTRSLTDRDSASRRWLTSFAGALRERPWLTVAAPLALAALLVTDPQLLAAAVLATPASVPLTVAGWVGYALGAGTPALILGGATLVLGEDSLPAVTSWLRERLVGLTRGGGVIAVAVGLYLSADSFWGL